MRALVPIVVLLSALAACASRDDAPRSCSRVDDPCETDATCPEGTRCELVSWDYGAGRVCTRECSSQRDCPSAGGDSAHCLDVSRTGQFRCFAGCGYDWNCNSGQVCQPLARGGLVCLP